jgi:hypothetical protein
MPLAEAKHQSQLGRPSWMPLAKANHQSQHSRPSWMPLAETNQYLNQHFIIDLIFINNSINIS